MLGRVVDQVIDSTGSIVAEIKGVVERVERTIMLLAVMFGVAIVAVAAVLGLLAAGVVALAQQIGTAPALAISSGAVLLVAVVVGLMLWSSLTKKTPKQEEAEARREAVQAKQAAEEAVKAAEPPKPSEPPFDPVFVTASVVTAAVLLGPKRIVRGVHWVRQSVGLISALAAGSDLLAVAQSLMHLATPPEPEKNRGPHAPEAAI